MNSFSVIIPCRYASTRLPSKPLLDIAGKPLIQHVYESACLSKANNIYIACDDERIEAAAKSFNANVVMTSQYHESGTDRLAEAAKILNLADDEVIVNLQGDELGMTSGVINQVAEALHLNSDCNMATICEPIHQTEEVLDPNIVKVISDENNYALYFSRAPIPWDRDSNGKLDSNFHERQYYRHIGLYAYRNKFLTEFSQMQRANLEIVESLEQLRALYHGEKIHVSIAIDSTGIGIDTPEDLEKAREEWSKK